MIRCSLLPDQSTYRLQGDFPLVERANAFLKVAEARGLSLHTLRGYGNDLVGFFRWIEKTGKNFKVVRHEDLFEFIATEKKLGFMDRRHNHMIL